jgi:hypothetical protein
MSLPIIPGRIQSTLCHFLDNEASDGLVLMATAALAITVANSAFAEDYFHALHVIIGPLSLLHWINDALMALFFLVVGLEIKREMLDGQFSSWRRRLLPGAAALGGMVFPAPDLWGAQLVELFRTARVGDPDRDRHRLRARRDFAFWQSRPSLQAHGRKAKRPRTTLERSGTNS